MNILFYVIFFVGLNTVTPEFHSNVGKILRRIEETMAVFKNIPNEDIEKARLNTEFNLKHINPKTLPADLYITIPESEKQASNLKGVGSCPESNYTYFFLPHLVTLVCS